MEDKIKTDSYSRSTYEDGKYKLEEIKAFIQYPEFLEGTAIVTHIAGNGGIQFTLSGTTYHGWADNKFNRICNKASDNDYALGYVPYSHRIVYDCSKVIFDINIAKHWHRLYHYHPDTQNSYRLLPDRIKEVLSDDDGYNSGSPYCKLDKILMDSMYDEPEPSFDDNARNSED